jgi:hypothetical protein
MLSGAMQQLRGGHVTEPKVIRDRGQRTPLNRRLPQRVPLAPPKLLEDGGDHLPIRHLGFGVGSGVAIG